MSKLVNMDEYRVRQAATRGFASWQKHFDDSPAPVTRFSDLKDSTIAALAEPGENSAAVFYELIMGVLDLGTILKLDYLKPADRLLVVDTHLFLADTVRYEMLHRIRWINGYPEQDVPIVRLVMTYDPSDYSRFSHPPQLLQTHPQYREFNSRIDREKVVMLRQLFSPALAVLRAQLGNASNP